jgi:peptidoglycan/xylan/chitin deacetylase (PgdA/CDA1 family)
MFLFTFDDGPDVHTTPALLDRLDATGVRAIFFIPGVRIWGTTPRERRQAEIARDAVRRGHIVASHTFNHVQLPLMTKPEIIAELEVTERVFEKVFGSRPFLLRPPGGAYSKRVDDILREKRYTTMLWNIGTGDYQVRSADEVYQTWRRVLERRERENAERGGIVLMHDTHPWSVEAFQLIYDDLQRRNCDLLASGDELYDIVDDPSIFHTARVHEPAGTYAPPAQLHPTVLAARQSRLRREATVRCHALAQR